MTPFDSYRGFLIVLIPAAIGGAIWSVFGLPLAWLMGAAIVSGVFCGLGLDVTLPKFLYWPSLAIIGAGVGLSITPEVAIQIASWFPLMLIMGFAGVVLAAILTPITARRGGMEPSTAFFALMPGGVIEMASIGDPYGADRTTIATLHAIRVALVVGMLPLGLYLFYPGAGEESERALLGPAPLLLTIAVALVGGWLGMLVKLPAAWLLGALLTVAVLTASGSVSGQIPLELLAVAQVIVGISLGSKFKREPLRKLPRAIAVGGTALVLIIAIMAVLGVLFTRILPLDTPTLVLAFSIGGLAEMVLTAKALDANVAMVAAFQSIRAVLVNTFAGPIWKRLSPHINTRI